MLQLFCWDKMDPHLKFDSKVKTDDTTITHSPRRCEKLYLTIKRLAEERSSGFQTWKKKKNVFWNLGKTDLSFMVIEHG